jgi:hypothetical protein
VIKANKQTTNPSFEYITLPFSFKENIQPISFVFSILSLEVKKQINKTTIKIKDINLNRLNLKFLFLTLLTNEKIKKKILTANKKKEAIPK